MLDLRPHGLDVRAKGNPDGASAQSAAIAFHLEPVEAHTVDLTAVQELLQPGDQELVRTVGLQVYADHPLRCGRSGTGPHVGEHPSGCPGQALVERVTRDLDARVGGVVEEAYSLHLRVYRDLGVSHESNLPLMSNEEGRSEIDPG